MAIPALSARSWLQAAVLVAGLFILIGISAASFYFVQRARDDARGVTHSVEVENQISVGLLQIRRAESAERAYLITSLDNYLTDFDEAKSLIFPAFDALRRLTADNPKQQALLDQIARLIVTRVGEFDRVNALTRAGRLDEARNVVRQSITNRTTEKIRDLCNAMQAEEQRIFALRNSAAGRSQRIAALVTATGSGVLLALAAFSVMLVRSSSRARATAERRLRDINMDLEAAVDERTTRLREANAEIQRFAYIVSHDLRAPLVNIMGFTSELETLRKQIFTRLHELRTSDYPGVIREHSEGANPESGLRGRSPPARNDGAEPPLHEADKSLADDFEEALGFIKSSIDKMDRLIGAILKLSREGQREFRAELIDVRELIDAIATTIAHQATEANATIDLQPLPDITSDRLALEQIFSNLLDNALKYLRTDIPGRITVKGRRKLGYVIYDVVDNGRGIEDKDHDRIFDLFRRAGPQDRPGQGIGLAHVRALVRRLGGTLSVSSDLGQGSTFTVTLPSAANLKSPAASPQAHHGDFKF